MGEWRGKSIDHLALRLLALFLAVVLWFLATERPQRNLSLDQRVVSVEARLEHVADELEVTHGPGTVELTLEGPRLILPFQAQDVSAYLDVESLGAGRHQVQVQVRSPAGITVKQVEPDDVTLVLETRAQREVPVRVAVLGVPVGVTVQVLEVRPAVMEVYGATSAVNKVAHILAQLNYDTEMTQAPAVPVDASGEPVAGLATGRHDVDVVLVVSKAPTTGPLPSENAGESPQGSPGGSGSE